MITKSAGIAQLVELHVANVVVAGSSPVSRSMNKRVGRHSQVAKAAVCKTVIHRFESGCRLHSDMRVCGTI
jgi:hypothetical protein